MLFDELGRMQILDGMRYYKKTQEENNMPRFVITMTEKIDRECLQSAAITAMQRFCVQRLVVEPNESRFYLKQNLQEPVVHLDNGERHVVCNEKNRGHMTWIGYHECDIIVDFFHGVSDGIGMIPFLMLLLTSYCQKKYSSQTCEKANLQSGWNENEYTEAIRFLPEELVVTEHSYRWKSALQLKGRQMELKSGCHHYVLSVDGDAFDDYVTRNGSCRSAVFAMFMNQAIAGIHKVDTKPIVAAMAVNARKAYGAEETLQSCVATIPLWYDREIAELSVSERLKKGRAMVSEGIKKECVLWGAQKNRLLNQNLEANYPTLEEKRAHCRRLTDSSSGRYTYGLSYLGNISFGEFADAYVRDVRVMLCANTVPLILEILKWKGKYTISYNTHLEEDRYLKELIAMFQEAGITCNCIKHEMFEEALADF